MGAYKQVVYDKWDKGEFGTMNPAQAPNGSWTGNNVVPYKDGMIGPRPGMREITFSNSPSKNGPMLGFGFSPVAQAGNRPIFFILEDRAYAFNPAAGSPALKAAVPDLDAAPMNTDAQRVLFKESCRLIGGEVYFSVDNSFVYRLDLRADPPALTAITDSGVVPSAGTDLELFRDRLFSPNGMRVFYTDPADFETWPAGDFFDVGAAFRIVSVMTFRDALFFFTQSGVWSMTGSSPADGTFRRVSETLAPLDKAVVSTNDELLYIPLSRSAPVSFNGSYGNERALMHLEDWKSAAVNAYGVQSYGNRDVLFLSGNSDLLWRKNEAWSFHSVGEDVGPWITRYFDDNVVLAYPGTSSVDPRFFMLAMNIERPGFTSDQWAQPGDASDTPLDASFRLPDYLAPNGKEVRVRSITVDFVKYDTGSSVDNNISVTVSSQFREKFDGPDTDDTRTLFSEPGSEATTSGVYSRRVLRGFPVAWGGGYRISFSDIRGVAIDRVIVEIEEQNAPVT